MRYLGMDVHGKATVFCLLDAEGKTMETGSVPTTAPALSDLAQRLSKNDTLVAAQEVGTMCQFVHDAFTAAGVKILSFNAQQLRGIASSRKKTDKRDSFWIAKCLQTGMMPHPVYIPDGELRKLRSQLAIRANLTSERKRWLLRARSQLRAVGIVVPKGVSAYGVRSLRAPIGRHFTHRANHQSRLQWLALHSRASWSHLALQMQS